MVGTELGIVWTKPGIVGTKLDMPRRGLGIVVKELDITVT